jgi:hypothetical protein
VIMDLLDTWPDELRRVLEAEYDSLLQHAQFEKDSMDEYLAPKEEYVPRALMPSSPYFSSWEAACLAVPRLLQTTTLRGWHCTRLTDIEVADISRDGMRLSNLQFLTERILWVQTAGLIDDGVAESLISQNLADDHNRRDRIWFCFFPPHLAGQHGIERFFRRWGGEALYNCHEPNGISDEVPVTGEILKTFGRPCLIEADVPIGILDAQFTLGEKVIRRYLLSRGFDTEEDTNHEAAARKPIPARNIVRFIFREDAEFAALTGCDEWSPPL